MTEPEAARTASHSTPTAARLQMSSRDLFRGQREIVILHGRNEYLLRITRADKLILTK
jgi:hemin uptake protein HemP